MCHVGDWDSPSASTPGPAGVAGDLGLSDTEGRRGNLHFPHLPVLITLPYRCDPPEIRRLLLLTHCRRRHTRLVEQASEVLLVTSSLVLPEASSEPLRLSFPTLVEAPLSSAHPQELHTGFHPCALQHHPT